MPRTTEIQTNFSAGELTPRLHGRVDIEPYASGALALENVVVLVQGGARRRDGLRYRVAAKFATKKSRLIPFIYSETEAFVLEVGDQYIRFIKNGAQIAGPYEVATNILEAQLFEFDYAQSADAGAVMAITHKALAPQRLRRFADTNWVFDAIPFTVQPFDEIGDSFANSLTLSSAAVGAGRTFTASAATFLNGDVGRTIAYQGGFATITAFTSTTEVTATITSAFPSTSVPASVWTLGLSPQEAITASAASPVETVVTLTASVLNIWRSTDVGKFVRLNGGLLQVTGYTSGTVVNATIKQVLVGVTAAPKNSWSLEAGVWSVANGYPRACTFYQQRFMLAGSLAYPQTLWGSATGAYLDFTLGSFDDDAVSFTLASEQVNPILHLAATKILFALTYGGEFTIRGGVEKPITPTNVQADNQTNHGCSEVRPVKVDKAVLFAHRTGGKVRSITYNVDTAEYDAPDITVLAEHVTKPEIVDLTYSEDPEGFIYGPRSDGVLATLSLSENPQVAAWSRQLTDGLIESACTVPSADGDQTYCLVQRVVNGATVRYIEQFDASAVYSFDSAVVAQVATATSINVLSVRLVQQGGPYGTTYHRFIDTNGVHGLAVGTPIRVSGVVATKYHDINGDHIIFEVPSTTSIRLTNITVSGSPGNYQSGGVVASGGIPTAVWSLAHLIGKTVECVADGYYMGEFVVSAGGTITLPRTAFKIVAGLPFRSRIEMLTPETQTGTGSAQGNSMRTSEGTVRFLESYTCDINGKLIDFAAFGGSLLGQPPQEFSGLKRSEELGWERGDSKLELGTSLPFPWHILSVTRKLQVND